MGRLRSALIAATLVSCTRSSGKEKLSRSCNRSSGKGKILFRSCTRSYGKGKLFRSFAQSSGTGKTFWGRKDLLEYLPCQSVCLCSFGPNSLFFRTLSNFLVTIMTGVEFLILAQGESLQQTAFYSLPSMQLMSQGSL